MVSKSGTTASPLCILQISKIHDMLINIRHFLKFDINIWRKKNVIEAQEFMIIIVMSFKTCDNFITILLILYNFLSLVNEINHNVMKSNRQLSLNR